MRIYNNRNFKDFFFFFNCCGEIRRIVKKFYDIACTIIYAEKKSPQQDCKVDLACIHIFFKYIL